MYHRSEQGKGRGRTLFLLALHILPLTTNPFRDGGREGVAEASIGPYDATVCVECTTYVLCEHLVRLADPCLCFLGVSRVKFIPGSVYCRLPSFEGSGGRMSVRCHTSNICAAFPLAGVGFLL